MDADGVVLEEPVPLADVRDGGTGTLESPQSPYLEDGERPAVGASKGFEAMAGSRNGRYLYPILEGALADDDDPRRRLVLEFDTRTREYTGRTWDYETDTDANLVGDAFLTGQNRLLVLERDDLDGPAAVTKRVYAVDLRRTYGSRSGPHDTTVTK